MREGPTCHVYLVGFRSPDGRLSGPVKVGITTDVEKRLKSIQTGSPRRLFLGAYLSTPNREIALAMESCFHEIFDAHRMSGEWFDMEPAIALKGLCDTFASAFDHFLSEDQSVYDAACERSGLNAALALLEEIRAAAE